MGRLMASRLVKAGFELLVSDLVPQAVSELTAIGAAARNTPAQIAGEADLICFSLPNSEVLSEVLTGPDGVFSAVRPGTLLIDFSSVAPNVSQRLAKEAETRGASMLDAPVSGGVLGAEKGQLTIMVGGQAEDLERAGSVLKELGKKIIHVGPHGQGQAMKLVNNLLLGINMVGAAEALTLGHKLGLNPQAMAEIIGQSSGASYAFSAKAEKFIFAGHFGPGFAVDLQYKDLELAVTMAKNLTVPLFMGNQAQQIFEVARAKGQGREDISSVIKLYEEAAKTLVRKDQ
jgi:3-hydroxyisobutyrate dehydrogenase